ncbi:pancreas/duodenum homeobox protein 1 [Pseudodesulfovibrio cashew]|uniref:Pancreas/duodenum homeobox protein 1 n=1 Tax=Pseudodesulfovibrio cashew TaxID=2678688 RepID=A0A6I6JFE2_9BACT|nr:pancreas/duodenum homeobox protein 1 [Pseudodesulfovibrio cashew]QGY38717.1 pancreas/duodenum homeobox protein 1 [Pseudodesulfovibrio cashew]
MTQYGDIFTGEKLAAIFPPDKTDRFFEALFGEAEEGSYDISLDYVGAEGDTLGFELKLTQRPGKCLACNLTYGLPQVFSRHPVIDLAGVAEAVAGTVGRKPGSWELGRTREVSKALHVVPLTVVLD